MYLNRIKITDIKETSSIQQVPGRLSLQIYTDSVKSKYKNFQNVSNSAWNTLSEVLVSSEGKRHDTKKKMWMTDQEIAKTLERNASK